MPQLSLPALSRAVALLTSAALVAALSAALAPRSADAAPASRFLDPVVHDRPVHARNGPFFALRVHSMDVAAEAKTLAAFEYACTGFDRTGPREKYVLVRTHYEGKVAPGACDEILGLLVPRGAKAEYFARAGTTRWIRREGPAGTPVGGFVGRMQVAATVTLASSEVLFRMPLLDLAIAGTSGLRPMRGDPADATALDEGRCTAPTRDEGWYVGGFHRRTLVRFLREDPDDPARIALARTLSRALVAGNFEGRVAFADDADRAIGHAKVARAAWWFDGLAAADCRPHRRHPAPVADVAVAADIDAAVEVEIR